MKIYTVLLFMLVLAGCSREQTNEITASVAKSYLASTRDNNIKNWQARVASTPACAEFKDRFKTAGNRYDNSANGMYVNDMDAIWKATKTAGCAAPV